MSDFSVCPHGPCGVRQADLDAVVSRLDELMRQCRDEQHQVAYADLVDVRFGAERISATPREVIA